jgi:hypothetical protein
MSPGNKYNFPRTNHSLSELHFHHSSRVFLDWLPLPLCALFRRAGNFILQPPFFIFLCLFTCTLLANSFFVGYGEYLVIF